MEKEITINKYINGELTGLALSQFEALLKEDKALAEEVQFHKEVDKALAIHEEVESNENLKSLLKDLGKTHIQDKPMERVDSSTQKREAEIIANPEIFPENEPKVKFLKRYAWLAAAAALLLFLPNMLKKSNPELADHHFNLFQLNDTEMGNGNIDQLYKKAKANYADGQFKEANVLFREYDQAKPNVPKVWLAIGSAEFKLNDLDAALRSFQKVLNMNESEAYHPQVHWFLALCYLKKDEPEKAISHLNGIKEGQDYYLKAKKLIKKLL